MLDIALLGTGGMIPLHDRHLAAMLARYGGHMLLIDCGEGTQVSMRQLGWGFINLDVILITHIHADHIAGLPGLLLSLSNFGRTEPLTIAGPEGIEHVVNSLRVIAPELMYPIEYKELTFENNSTMNVTLGGFQVSAILLEHRLPCIGYSLYIPRTGKFNVERARELEIPLKLWSKLQSGEAAGGFTPDMVLGKERKGIKVSYITDTRPIHTIPEFVQGSDLFICEGLYGDEEMKQQAERFYHMIFSDAAKLAKEGEVKELWLTHYSQSLRDPENHVCKIESIFKNCKAGKDHMQKTFLFED